MEALNLATVDKPTDRQLNHQDLDEDERASYSYQAPEKESVEFSTMTSKERSSGEDAKDEDERSSHSYQPPEKKSVDLSAMTNKEKSPSEDVKDVIIMGLSIDELAKQFFEQNSITKAKIITTTDKTENSSKKLSLRLDYPSFAPIFNDKDTSRNNKVYHYLKGFIHFNNRQQAKDDFVALAGKVYSKDKDKEKIKEFEDFYNEYDRDSILNWYTQDSFFFKLLNNSLRMATADAILCCRLVIKDIEAAIKAVFKQKSRTFSGMLYRGCYLSDKEWIVLQKNHGRDIEMNCFLSTSKSEKIAKRFLKQDSSKKIFITIIVPETPLRRYIEEGPITEDDVNVKDLEDQTFAEIKDLSRYKKEEEVLFNIRSRFMVVETKLETRKDGSEYRHLILFHGAHTMRIFVANNNSKIRVSINKPSQIKCKKCHKLIHDNQTSNMMLVDMITTKDYVCLSCAKDFGKDDKVSYLCVPVNQNKNESMPVEVDGIILKYNNPHNTTFCEYSCNKCKSNKSDRYRFSCLNCSKDKKSWCRDCFDPGNKCIQNKHSVIMESHPFSFWCTSAFPQEIQAMKIKRKHWDIIKTDHQGKAFRQAKDFDKAQQFFEELLKITKEDDKKSLSRLYHQLGEVYIDLQKFSEALEIYTKQLQTSRELLEDEQKFTAIAHRQLGFICINMKKNEEALEHYLRFFEFRSKRYGNEHLHTATAYSNIGSTYIKLKNYPKALENLQKCLEIRKKLLKKDHMYTVTTYKDIGEIHEAMEKYDKAEKYYRKYLDISLAINGEDDTKTAMIYGKIGSLYMKQRRLKEALESYLSSLRVYKNIGNKDNTYTASAYSNLGDAYFEMKDYSKAKKNYSEYLRINERVYIRNSERLGTVKVRLEQINRLIKGAS